MSKICLPTHRADLIVLSLISGGLLAVLILIICGLFGWFESKVQAPLPNWAENVLVAIATASTLKLGDCLAALVSLATGRQVEGMSQQLASSTPVKPRPAPPQAEAVEAAQDVADAAQDKADEIDMPRPSFGDLT